MEWLFADIDDFSKTQYLTAYNALSPSKKIRVDRLKQPDDRRRTLAAELLLKKLLGEKFQINNAVIHASPDGKPYLEEKGFYISIAHSKNKVACAVDSNPVGIDIEFLRPVNLTLTRRICTPAELEYIFGKSPVKEDYCYCEDKEILYRFYSVWTAKEAYFKKCGNADYKSVNTLNLSNKQFFDDGYLVCIV